MRKRGIYISGRRVLTDLFICFYRLLLDVCYFQKIAISYAYYGFRDERTMGLLVLSWIVLLGSFLFISRLFLSENGHVSNIVIFTIYMIAFVPYTTCIYAGLYNKSFLLVSLTYWFVLFVAQDFAQRIPLKRIPRLRSGNVAFTDNAAVAIGIMSLLLVVFISGRYVGFRLDFTLTNVYTYREEARSYNMPTVIVYLFSWSRAINTVLLAYCLIHRKRWLGMLFFFTQMLSFGIDGLKSTFFMPFVVVIIVLLSRKMSIRQIKIIVLLGFVGLAFVAVLEMKLLNSTAIVRYFIRRIMFVPNYLNRCYYDFFSNNPPDYFRSSFLRFFGVKSPYSQGSRGISYIIGALYFNRPTMNCNNGLLSDAITNLGKPGALIMPVFLVTVLHYFDRSAYKLDMRLTITTALFVSYTIVSSFIFTVLLTHGLLMIILLLSMFNPESSEGIPVSKAMNRYYRQL